ncbi:alpha/beta hydrolase fold domain-containing protein [Asanoa sp. WMMD1127]|uniref:alpha/beta hydrolase fold domain-containing protein n=1 Tax=Asanoa sp. WMMD1127 TaxID=3016107 RepID=UPI00241626A2|nr:alpha/beta hydrolase fold domain-containing protein [Asanoa sp. WMMD1127]MDG4826560.1 alpha/beta hydrolase fold domain-containing protein [Asanoa sp. WMMD1127]
MPVSPQALAFWAAMRAADRQVDLPVAARRAAGEHAEDATSVAAGVRETPWPAGDGLRVTAASPRSRVLYLFGGGYVLGSPASRRRTAGHLAVAADAEVFLSGYRLAPEHPHPAALEDVLTAYARLDPPAFVAGDSSGGGLALALALAAPSAGLPPPTGVVCLSPWADLTCSGSTMDSHVDRDIECTRASLLEMAGWYGGDHDPRDPLVSPAFADFAGFPPVLVLVGSEEVLLSDALAVAGGVGAAGGDATLRIAAGMQHTYPIWCGAFPEADAAMREAGDWIRARS